MANNNIPSRLSSDFPFDVPKYMKLNAQPQISLKLMQVCKFFQHKEFPFLVINFINFIDENHWSYSEINGNECEKSKIQDIETQKKLWILRVFFVSHYQIKNFVIPKIAVCDIQELGLLGQNLFYKDYKILTSSGNVEEMHLLGTVIKFENGDPVFINSLLKCVPKLKIFKFFNRKVAVLPDNFGDNFMKIKTSKLETLGLTMFSYSYFQMFLKFMEKNPHIRYELKFNNGCLSPEDILNLKSFVKGILDAGVTKFPPPLIFFNGEDAVDKEALKALNQKYISQNEM